MPDSSDEELFELDSEDDDIVTQRLRRAGKARRSAPRKAEDAPPETAQVSERGTLAASDDDDADFEIDPPDDDIFARRRPKAKAPAPAGTGRWFLVAIIVGVVAGVVLGAVLLSGNDKSAQPDPHASIGMDGVSMEQIAADIAALEAQLAEDPNSYEAHVDLGGLLCRTTDIDAAFEHLTTATGLEPNRPEAWLLTGMCHASQNPPNTADARWALTKVIELDPESEYAVSAQSLLDSLDGGSTEPTDGEP